MLFCAILQFTVFLALWPCTVLQQFLGAIRSNATYSLTTAFYAQAFEASWGSSWKGEHTAGQGPGRAGRQGEARRCEARRCEARRGEAGLGKAGQGRAGQGKAGPGKARQGKAGQARQGKARQGDAKQGRQGSRGTQGRRSQEAAGSPEISWVLGSLDLWALGGSSARRARGAGRARRASQNRQPGAQFQHHARSAFPGGYGQERPDDTHVFFGTRWLQRVEGGCWLHECVAGVLLHGAVTSLVLFQTTKESIDFSKEARN